MKVLDADYNVEALEKKLVVYQINSSSATNGKSKKSYVKKMCIKDNLDFLLNVRFRRLWKAKEYVLAIKQLYRLEMEYMNQIL